MDNQNALDELVALRARLDTQVNMSDLARASILAPVADALAHSDATWRERIAATQAQIDALTERINTDVLAAGLSLKSATLQAVYIPAGERATWDDGALRGFAAEHPAILQFRKTTITPARVDIRARK